MKKPKYSGKLARPITPGLIELAQHGSFDEWLKSDRPRQEFINRMYDLLDHYKIDPSDRDCWFALGCELAADHIKGFSFAPSYKSPGRPKKTSLKDLQIKRPPHRPTVHTMDNIIKTVRGVDELKKEIRLLKKGHVTDKAALEQILSDYAKSKNIRVARFLKKELVPAQKKLSRYREKIRKSKE